MPKLIVYRCDEPGCKEFIEIDAVISVNMHGKTPFPEDWHLDTSEFNKTGEYIVHCPKHNQVLGAQRAKKTQREIAETFERDLEKNPPLPSGGLILPSDPRSRNF